MLRVLLLNTFFPFYHILYFQPDLYGVDWESPTPSNDEHAVTVNELPIFLTGDRKTALDIEISHLPSISGVNILECLISHYMAAKLFIHTVRASVGICH